MNEAWFSALGEALGDAERDETWGEAFAICAQPAEAWWRAEEAERNRLEETAKLNPAEPEWLALNEALHGAAAVAAAGAGRSASTQGASPFSDERR